MSNNQNNNIVIKILGIIFLCLLCVCILSGLYLTFMKPSNELTFATATVENIVEKTTDPTIIGMWEDDSNHDYDHVVILRFVDGKYYQTEYYKKDGSSGTTELKLKVVNDERRYLLGLGDYMIIESNGNLAYYDGSGFIYDIHPIHP